MRAGTCLMFVVLASCGRHGFGPSPDNGNGVDNFGDPGPPDNITTGDTDDAPPVVVVDSVRVLAQPTGGNAGETLVNPPVFEVDDASGNVVTSATGTVTLSLSDGSVLSGTRVIEISNGVADFSSAQLMTERSGTFQLVVHYSGSNGDVTVTSASFDVAPPSFTSIERVVGPWDPRGHVDGPPPTGQVDTPVYAATDGTYIYFSDYWAATIRRYTIADSSIVTLAGSPYQNGSVDGTGSAARFYRPSGLALYNGSLYIADTANQTVRRLQLSNNSVTTFAGTPGRSGLSNSATPPVLFSSPNALAVIGTSLYMGECGNTIRQIDLGTGTVTQFLGDGTATDSTGTATGTAAKIRCPVDLAASPAGDYLYSISGSTLRAITVPGAYPTTLASASQSRNVVYDSTLSQLVFSHDSFPDQVSFYDIAGGRVASAIPSVASFTSGELFDGDFATARFNLPRGMTFVGSTLYLLDSGNAAIRAIDMNAKTVTTVLGSVAATHAQSNGVGENVQVRNIAAITDDGVHLYFTDGNAIHRLDPMTQTVDTFAGADGLGGFSNAVGVNARFGTLSGITTDGATLYVSDSTNYAIRAIDIATATVVTVAGNDVQGTADGVGDAANFYSPGGIGYSGGVLYVVDGSNSLRRIDIATRTVTTLSQPADNTCTNGAQFTFRSATGVVATAQTVYVIDQGCAGLRAYDVPSGTVSVLATTLGYNDSGAAGFDGRYLYVPHNGEGVISRIDTQAPYTVVQSFVGLATDPRELDGPIATTARAVHPHALYYGYGSLWVPGDVNIRRLR